MRNIDHDKLLLVDRQLLPTRGAGMGVNCFINLDLLPVTLMCKCRGKKSFSMFCLPT